MLSNANKNHGVFLILNECPPVIAEVLQPLDIDGNGCIDREEIVEAAQALTSERGKNLQLKRIVLLMFYRIYRLGRHHYRSRVRGGPCHEVHRNPARKQLADGGARRQLGHQQVRT